MFDAIPRQRQPCARTDIYAECAAKLGVPPAAFRAQVALEIDAGRSRRDALNSAYLHLADPTFGLRGPSGVVPDDPALAAAFRGSPRRDLDAAGRRGSALVRLGDALDWQSQVLCDFQHRDPVLGDAAVGRLAGRLGIATAEALRRLTIAAALRQQAWGRWPSNTRCGRKRRAKFVGERLASLGYWPDLSQQIYLPAPARAGETANSRCSPHATPHAMRQRRVKEAEQLAFGGEGWRVTA